MSGQEKQQTLIMAHGRACLPQAGSRYSPACTQTHFGLKQTAPSLAQSVFNVLWMVESFYITVPNLLTEDNCRTCLSPFFRDPGIYVLFSTTSATEKAFIFYENSEQNYRQVAGSQR